MDGQRAKEEVRKWKEEKGRMMEEVLGDVGVKWRLARVETKAANLLNRNRNYLSKKTIGRNYINKFSNPLFGLDLWLSFYLIIQLCF